MGLMFAPLRRYVDFSGRSRRLEYWLWVIFVFVGLIVAMVLDAKLGLGGTHDQLVPRSATTRVRQLQRFRRRLYHHGLRLAGHHSGLALSIRRMHDQNRSGWWILVPLVGAIMIMFIGGTAGPNRFGPIRRAAPARRRAGLHLSR